MLGIGAMIRRMRRAAKATAYALGRSVGRIICKSRHWSEGAMLYPLDVQDCQWDFHDERWVRVVHRWTHRRALREGRSLSVFDNPQNPGPQAAWDGCKALAVDVPDTKPDRWVYFYLDPVQHKWRDFQWDFVVSRGSHFRELQFGFRYVDFYNRYRFRHEDDHFHFDVVRNGRFYNGIGRRHFPMELLQDYHISIRVTDRRFRLLVDRKLLLDECDLRNHFPRGSCAIILWENDNAPPIQAWFRDMRVLELQDKRIASSDH